ncbi:MAG: ABC transporter substrate-binding protein [Betaproteobacteria bacterium]|nr:ABC transporter substrate-binding protein [Betaproteobacteria bacterium]
MPWSFVTCSFLSLRRVNGPVVPVHAARATAVRAAGALILALVSGVLAAPAAWSQSAASLSLAQLAPQDLIASVTQDVLETAKNDRSLQQKDLRRISDLVDQKVMPIVNFSRMTALAVGRHWRTATPEQQQRLMAAFRELLVLTYAEAVRFLPESTVEIRPARYLPTDEDVIVRTLLLRTGKEPIPLDYRLQKTPEGWKIYDFNVLGLWIVEYYRSQFGQLVSAKGIEGLITSLEQKNQALRQAVLSGKG